MHRPISSQGKVEEALGSGRPALEEPPAVRRIPRRFSADGNWLPVIGLVVDDDIEIDVTDPFVTEVGIGALRLTATEGVANDEWQIVILRRSNTNSVSSHVRDYASMKALHLLGVRQVFSADRAHIPGNKHFDRDIDFLAGTALSMCPRLSAAMNSAAEFSGFNMLSNDVQITLTSATRTEAVAAATLGMCYAALNVVEDTSGTTAGSMTALALRTAPQKISPLSTCSCRTIHI